MLDAAESYVSAATPQWAKVRAMQELLAGPKDSPIKLRLERGEPAERIDVTVSRTATGYTRVAHADVISEVQPGILYVDLGRITPADFTEALPRLAAAKGLVFDLRTPPAALGPELLLSHLSDKQVTGPQQHLPQIAAPDREQTTFVRSGEWNFAPQEPFLSAPKVFLADAHAIGYGESILAIVQALKLGQIVGGTTAGTNGTTNRFQLPGDYTVIFTGMKVLQHDGSPHHGVGIQPSVPVAVTRAARAAGRDELLDKAVELLGPG
jgi:C-terminal processing protease CtpA/Prc